MQNIVVNVCVEKFLWRSVEKRQSSGDRNSDKKNRNNKHKNNNNNNNVGSAWGPVSGPKNNWGKTEEPTVC